MDADSRKYLLKFFNEREPDEKLLFSKVLNQVSLCEKNHDLHFSDFLDPYRANKYVSALKSLKSFDLNIKLFGGYEAAERLIIGFAPGYIELKNESFPISVVKIKYDTRFTKELTHRDFLGSILGLGIERTKVGDILLEEGHVFAYMSKDIAEYVVFNLDKVAHSKVRSEIYESKMAEVDEKQLEKRNIIISSLRIDAFISAAFKLSRSKAAELISSEKVFINWQPVRMISKPVSEGDVITLRGKGRAKIDKIAGKTKKDRFVLSITN